jgi:hypothetical protein
MPGLKKAVFAIQPRWLRPVDNIDAPYSSITFAVSDPDSAITDALLNNRTALVTNFVHSKTQSMENM